MQFGTSKVEIKHRKISRRLRAFFKGGRSVRAAQKSIRAALPMDVQPQNDSQMVDEHDRSTKLEDLNLKDRPLEDSFKSVSNFLDSMPSNWIPSPSSVSLSKRSSLYETCVQIYQKQDHQVDPLEQQMDEISAFLEQSTLRREKLLARALAKMQLTNAEVQVHLGNADINYSDAVKSEPLTPPTKDMGVDPRTPQPCVLLTLCLNITPMTMGCASATSTQVIRRMNEYQSHPPLPYRKIR